MRAVQIYHDTVQAAAELVDQLTMMIWKETMVVATAAKKTARPTTFIRARVRPWGV
jgi:hypothetical protein